MLMRVVRVNQKSEVTAGKKSRVLKETIKLCRVGDNSLWDSDDQELLW